MEDYQKGLIGYTNSRQVNTVPPLADFERDVIIYFFGKLKLADPRFYNQAMPDEKTEKITKREYSQKLRYLTNEQIDKGFIKLHQLMSQNDPDYRFLTIPKVIGLCDGSAMINGEEGVQAGAHKPFAPLQLPDLTAISKSKQAGRAELDKMLSMFYEPPNAPPTPEEIEDLKRLERIRNGQ